MRIPIMRGTIDRRILVNYRVDPHVLSPILPNPFRPQIMNGYGIAGICLIRLKNIRPQFLPAFAGIGSENAAHRIAVEWEQSDEPHVGVYVPRRDTSSRLNTLAGGRFFPGVHHHARFQTDEGDGRYCVQLDSLDGDTHVRVEGRVADSPPGTSIFTSMEEASAFFEGGSLGYSATACPGEYDGLELRTLKWHMDPLRVEKVESSFFEDRSKFPPGSVVFDSAFLMRSIDHEWHGRPTLSGEACEVH